MDSESYLPGLFISCVYCISLIWLGLWNTKMYNVYSVDNLVINKHTQFPFHNHSSKNVTGNTSGVFSSLLRIEHVPNQ